MSFRKELIPIACVVDEDLLASLNVFADGSDGQITKFPMPWESFTYITSPLHDQSHDHVIEVFLYVLLSFCLMLLGLEDDLFAHFCILCCKLFIPSGSQETAPSLHKEKTLCAHIHLKGKSVSICVNSSLHCIHVTFNTVAPFLLFLFFCAEFAIGVCLP